MITRISLNMEFTHYYDLNLKIWAHDIYYQVEEKLVIDHFNHPIYLRDEIDYLFTIINSYVNHC